MSETMTEMTEANIEEPATEVEQIVEEQSEPQTFDAEYVKALRAEAAEYRVKAKRADGLAKQALTAIVVADGRLIDPSDLAHSDDFHAKDGTLNQEAVVAALNALIEAKPHLARKRPTSSIAQGVRPSKSEPNLLQIIQSGN
jgi:hypothetical protein